jgi:hypothetical protein
MMDVSGTGVFRDVGNKSGSDIYELTSAKDGIRFKLKQTGATWATTEAQQIAWTKPGSLLAVLVLPNPDGTVTTGDNVFGNVTHCQDGQLCPNGFAALGYWCDRVEAGGNGDGICDSRDRLFSRLRWLVGKPDSGKLYTMQQLGIFSIDVGNYKQLQGRELLTDSYGNEFWYQGVADLGMKDLGNGVQTNFRDMYDVLLRDEPTR